MNVNDAIKNGEVRYTIRQAAEYLLVPEEFVRNLINAGKLPALRLGPRKQFVFLSDLEHFARNCFQT